jgi:3-methyl-2-oxobutanoate hydroxymethyltransferase
VTALAPEKVRVPALQAMKRDGRKIVGIVAWDCQMARIADRVGAEIISVGDSVGVNLWGQPDPRDVTLDEMLVVCRAVRRGADRALVSCDFPFGPLQAGTDDAVRAAVRLAGEGGADLVKLDGAADFPDAVAAISEAGVPVFAQIELPPQAPSRDGAVPATLVDKLVADAARLQEAGAALIDFKHSGPVAGLAVTRAVAIPVLGGLGGGPWLDGRIRMAHAAIGYAASGLDDPPDTYANVARIAHDALAAYAEDVRASRQIKGGIPIDS